MQESRKILVTAYHLQPYRRGAGQAEWKLAEQVARYQEVYLVTRLCNRAAIEDYVKENDFVGKDRLHLLYFGQQRAAASQLAYWRWQRQVIGFIRQQNLSLDLVQDFNFTASWVPTFLDRLGLPLIWGPIGHQPNYPGEYIKRSYGSFRFAQARLAHWAQQLCWRYAPPLRRAAEAAQLVVGTHAQVQKDLGLSPTTYRTLSIAGADFALQRGEASGGRFEVLAAGPFVVREGFDLAIKSFARFFKALPAKQQRQARLTLIGSGPLEGQLRALIAAKGVTEAVRVFHGQQAAQRDLLFQEATVFLHPSHEGNGEAVVEALAYGLPVLCLDHTGPGEIIDPSCGGKVPYGAYEHTVDHFTQYLHQLFVDKSERSEQSRGARQRFETYFTWEQKGLLLNRLYAEVLAPTLIPPIYTS